MILQALNDYYRRAIDAGDAEIAPPGWIRKSVDFVLLLNSSGQAVSLLCRQDIKKGKRKPGKAELLPNIGKQAQKHTNSGVDANLLWDNAAFSLGLGKDGSRKLQSFLDTISSRFTEPNTAIHSVSRFLHSLLESDDALALIPGSEEDQQLLATGSPIVTFALTEDAGQLLCHREDIRKILDTPPSSGTHELHGVCLITGLENVPIAENETVIKRVWKAQSSGANIISFNKRAFESYGKTERGGENAPISLSASFAYTTALNHLLRDGSRNRTQVGDASTVFWAEREDPLETAIPDLFGEPPKDDPDRHVQAVKALYQAIDSGRLAGTDGATRYYVLGLAPNAARIAVRFFHCLPLHALAERIQQHFDDICLVHGPREHAHLSLFRLLVACAVQGKADNIPPNLGGAVVEAILTDRNAPYPSQLLNLAVVRCRAEQDVSYPRAAAIKACLNRSSRRLSQEKEFLPMLDPENTNTAYRLGRLFAVLEKIQEEASPGLNATIRDRYYGAASSTPVAVFTTLLRLKNAHLKKLPQGRTVWFEKLLGEVLSCVTDFPAHLALAEQGRFALGYYHQRQAFFTKSDKTESTEENN